MTIVGTVYKYHIQLDTNPKLTLGQNLTLSTGHRSLNVFDLLAPFSHHVIFLYFDIFMHRGIYQGTWILIQHRFHTMEHQGVKSMSKL